MFPKLFNPASGVGIAKSAIPPHPDHPPQPRRNVKAPITNSGTIAWLCCPFCVLESPRRGAECRFMQYSRCAGDGECGHMPRQFIDLRIYSISARTSMSSESEKHKYHLSGSERSLARRPWDPGSRRGNQGCDPGSGATRECGHRVICPSRTRFCRCIIAIF